jgi:PKD repeat protein
VTNSYAAGGSYTVVLTVNGAGGVSSATNYIVVTNAPPVAGFSGTPTNGFAPLQVAFTDGSSGSITNWAWNFGDGNSVTNSSAISVTNSYAVAGSYTVILTVSGSGGVSAATNTAYIVVKPKPVISKTVLSNGSLVLSGTNGPAGVQYRILATTNVATALTNWVPVWTNVFGTDGSYSYTNTTPTNSAKFFILKSP